MFITEINTEKPSSGSGFYQHFKHIPGLKVWKGKINTSANESDFIKKVQTWKVFMFSIIDYTKGPWMLFQAEKWPQFRSKGGQSCTAVEESFLKHSVLITKAAFGNKYANTYSRLSRALFVNPSLSFYSLSGLHQCADCFPLTSNHLISAFITFPFSHSCCFQHCLRHNQADWTKSKPKSN